MITLLAGCSEFEDLTPKSETVREYIGRNICTDSNLFVWQWNEDGVSYSQQQFSLYLPAQPDRIDETLDQHTQSSKFEDWAGKSIDDVLIIEAGARFTVREIYFYRNFNDLGYLIMASVAGSKGPYQMVEISSLFTSKRLIDAYEVELNPKYAHLCEGDVSS